MKNVNDIEVSTMAEDNQCLGDIHALEQEKNFLKKTLAYAAIAIVFLAGSAVALSISVATMAKNNRDIVGLVPVQVGPETDSVSIFADSPVNQAPLVVVGFVSREQVEKTYNSVRQGNPENLVVESVLDDSEYTFQVAIGSIAKHQLVATDEYPEATGVAYTGLRSATNDLRYQCICVEDEPFCSAYSELSGATRSLIEEHYGTMHAERALMLK